MNPADTSTKRITDRLAAFGAAWHRKDVEQLLECVTDDCVYSASVGPEPGATFRGKGELREGFVRMLAHDSAAERREGQSWVFGDHVVSLWSFVYCDEQGRASEVKGIDLFEFAGDKIRLKDAYRKTFPADRLVKSLPQAGRSG